MDPHALEVAGFGPRCAGPSTGTPPGRRRAPEGGEVGNDPSPQTTDRHSQEVFTMDRTVEWCEETLEAFTRHLTRGTDSPLSKFRVVFTWVATNIAYDVDAFLQHTHTPGDAETGWSALRRRRATCSGYADLLQRMCRSCGIECAKVQGYAKGAGYVPGRGFTPLTPNHEWNAVCLEDRWYPTDVCWSAGYLQQSSDTFVFKLTDHYFLPDPEVFLVDHLPLDPAWQLLPRSPAWWAQTLEGFQRSVHLKQGFFQHGMSAVCPAVGVLEVEAGEVEVILEFPYPLALTYELRHLDTGYEYSKCVSFRVGSSSAQFVIRPVLLGAHTFKVYGKVRGCREEPVSLTTHTLEVGAVSPNRPPWTDLRFPWGATRHLAELGLEEVGTSCSCLSPRGNGAYKVAFTCADPRVSLTPALYELIGGKVRRCQSARTCKLSEKLVGRLRRRITVTVTPPSPGHYWLSISASRFQDCNAPGRCVANLLICSLSDIPAAGPVPTIDTRWRHDCTHAPHCRGPELRGYGTRGGKEMCSGSQEGVELFSVARGEAILRYVLDVDVTTIGRLAHALLHVCAKIKYHSQQSCIRLIQYMIE